MCGFISQLNGRSFARNASASQGYPYQQRAGCGGDDKQPPWMKHNGNRRSREPVARNAIPWAKSEPTFVGGRWRRYCFSSVPDAVSGHSQRRQPWRRSSNSLLRESSGWPAVKSRRCRRSRVSDTQTPYDIIARRMGVKPLYY
jgi:hypothetical protein